MADDEQGNLRTFQDAVAIITGGASGIGRALGDELAARGCNVILADRQLDLAETAAQQICSRGGKASASLLDVTDAKAFDGLLESVIETHQRIDYVFNNAGIAVNGKFEDFGLEDWQKIIDVNLRGVVNGARAAQKVMSRQGFGHIVNMASFAGIFPWPTTIPYTATKHAVVGMSATMRAELKDNGIQVSVICPGTIMTPMIEQGAAPERWVGDYSKEKLEAFFASASGMAPDVFARKALDQVARNKAIIVLPLPYKVLWWINRLSPSLAIGLSNKVYTAILQRISD